MREVLVVKDKEGREVGRIAASAANRMDRIQELTRQHGAVQVDIETVEFIDLLAPDYLR